LTLQHFGSRNTVSLNENSFGGGAFCGEGAGEVFKLKLSFIF